MQRFRQSPPWHDSSGSTTPRKTAAESASLYLRNYDFQWGYDIVVEATETTTDTQVKHRYYLQPGELTTDHDALPAGEYDVEVTLDNDHRTAATITVSEVPEETLFVECGNGALSVTQGLY